MLLTAEEALLWLAAVTVLALGALAVAAWAASSVVRARDDVDCAQATADDAVDAVNGVIDHLAGVEPPAEGRHSHP